MEKPTIVIKLKVKQFSAILALAETVYENLNGNSHFVSPNPSLAALQAGIINLTTCLERWGVKSNRGSHEDYVNLENAARQMHTMLGQLARYCESTTRTNVPVGDQEAVLSSTGFALKKPKTPQGVLEMVQNFHRFIARNVKQGNVKLRWEMPLNVTTHTNVKCYDVYRNTTNDFATATLIKTVTTGTYTDAPDAGKWFYWVVPVNNMGYGVTSHVVVARTFGVQ